MEPLAKPRLRGVFHEYAFYCAVVAGTILVALSDSARELVATWIYAGALAAMFGVSALYHRIDWRSTRVRTWMRRLDHSTILLLIAGTYTPFAVLAFDGAVADVILVGVWAGAAAGLVLNLAWIDAPKWLVACVFVALGWIGVVALPQMFELGIAPTTLVLAGGVLYTLGALAYAFRRPNPAPAVFGYHEIFHLLVIGAAVTHFVAIAAFVVPRA
jgi:hemolysin III